MSKKKDDPGEPEHEDVTKLRTGRRSGAATRKAATKKKTSARKKTTKKSR